MNITIFNSKFPQVCPDAQARNKLTAQSMLILASIMHLGKSALPKKPISDDDVDWLSLCIRVLNDRCVQDLLGNSLYFKLVVFQLLLVCS